MKPNSNSSGQKVRFISTRYQGCKAKILDWIWSWLQQIPFDSCLDAFGGTGAVAYLFKKQLKQVVYNDFLHSNYMLGKALIENQTTGLSSLEIIDILDQSQQTVSESFIQDTFPDIFYLPQENAWLDRIVPVLNSIDDEYKQAIAFSAVCQACLIKRPFNLFHRANLNLRLADVPRNFGNKVSWDKPFPDYFQQFATEISSAVFDNGRRNRALCADIFDIKPEYDLVYIDTPYINQKGMGTDYLDYYHFLEGLLDYAHWSERIDYRYKHLRLRGEKSIWCQPQTIHKAFEKLFFQFRDSILVVSYRAPGIPNEQELFDLLSAFKTVTVHSLNYQYALSKKPSQELLFIGT